MNNFSVDIIRLFLIRSRKGKYSKLTCQYGIAETLTKKISFIESSDQNVRIYEYLSSSQCLKDHIAQYKSEGQVYTRKNMWLHAYICCDDTCPETVSDIKTVTIEGKTYYLVSAIKYHCRDYEATESGITAFTIENNLLQTIPLFKYQEKILPNMFVCAYVSNGCMQERNYCPYYDEHKKSLYVPETKYHDDFNHLTGLWLIYQLKGNHFELTGKTAGPYYLHESIREFEYFESEMDTETYHHRIDALKNNRRLSLWEKGKTIDTKPYLIVEGKFDEDKSIFIFEKDGTVYKYPYYVTDDSYFIIEKNGKVILKEKLDKDSYLIDCY